MASTLKGVCLMNKLVTRQTETELAISSETEELIQSSIADSTLKRYQRLSKQLEAWLNGQILTDGRLADYITELHTDGKSSSTIAAGVEGFISGHSLRVGSAVSLAQAGASVIDMQNAGRWKSPQIPAHYAKAELAERGAVALHSV